MQLIYDLRFDAEGLYTKDIVSTGKMTISIPESSEVCFINSLNSSQNTENDWNPSQDEESTITRGEFNVLYSYKVSIFGTESDGQIIINLKPSENFCARDNNEIFMENKGTFVEVRKI